MRAQRGRATRRAVKRIRATSSPRSTTLPTTTTSRSSRGHTARAHRRSRQCSRTWGTISTSTARPGSHVPVIISNAPYADRSPRRQQHQRPRGRGFGAGCIRDLRQHRAVDCELHVHTCTRVARTRGPAIPTATSSTASAGRAGRAAAPCQAPGRAYSANVVLVNDHALVAVGRQQLHPRDRGPRPVEPVDDVRAHEHDRARHGVRHLDHRQHDLRRAGERDRGPLELRDGVRRRDRRLEHVHAGRIGHQPDGGAKIRRRRHRQLPRTRGLADGRRRQDRRGRGRGPISTGCCGPRRPTLVRTSSTKRPAATP